MSSPAASIDADQRARESRSPRRRADLHAQPARTRASLPFALYRAMGGTLLDARNPRAWRSRGRRRPRRFRARCARPAARAYARPPRGRSPRLIQAWRRARTRRTAAACFAALRRRRTRRPAGSGRPRRRRRLGKLQALFRRTRPHLAEHWQVSADFLDIVMQAWPELPEGGRRHRRPDPPPRRRRSPRHALGERAAETSRHHRRLHRHGRRHAHPDGGGAEAPARPHRPPRHRPGPHATRAGPRSHDAASHPQHALGDALKWLRLAPADVTPGPTAARKPRARSPRRRLLNEALAPAAETRDWNDTPAAHSPSRAPPKTSSPKPSRAFRSVEAEDESGRSPRGRPPPAPDAGNPEPDRRPGDARSLARPPRRRHPRALEPRHRPPPASPLHRTATSAPSSCCCPAGCAIPATPSQLLAVLKHAVRQRRPHARHDLHRLVSEHRARSPARPAPPHARWKTSPTASNTRKHDENDGRKARCPHCAALIRDIDSAARIPRAPPSSTTRSTARPPPKPSPALPKHIAGGAHVWAGQARRPCRAVHRPDSANSQTAMGAIDADDFAGLRRNRHAAHDGRAFDAAEHPRIAIWGPLEARLQRRDRMILASLNEGSWPKPCRRRRLPQPHAAQADSACPIRTSASASPRTTSPRWPTRPKSSCSAPSASTTSQPSPRAGSGACARSPPAASADAMRRKPPSKPRRPRPARLGPRPPPRRRS